MTPQEMHQISDLIAQAGNAGTVAFAALTHKIVIEGIGDAVITASLTAVLALLGGLAWLDYKNGGNAPGEAVVLWFLATGFILLLALYFGASALVEISAPDGVAVERILKAVHQ
jgi:hypothetical protein